MTRDRKRLGEQQMGLSKALRDVDPTHYITEAIRMTAHELLGKPHPHIPQLAVSTSIISHASPTHPPLIRGLPVCITKGSSESKLWQTCICRPGKDYKRAVTPPLGSKR